MSTNLREETLISWELQVILSIAILSQQAHLKFSTQIRPKFNLLAYRKNQTIVGRRNNIFKLLAIEDINCNKVTFGMAMLASFRGRNLYNL
ncbi:hypothetical protein SADUNF_Sadunf10G0123000 [Salix dunnii]|uniref:Uncharacterized protein n=1 Tax=Salix dunnii TaxID=1413687 RepID=A0A835JRR6_9ROSI|nr:hypothetical protein SADUNF_Sadunf10G0123000 [Salix dunnii]